jgi:hypothetical protein
MQQHDKGNLELCVESERNNSAIIKGNQTVVIRANVNQHVANPSRRVRRGAPVSFPDWASSSGLHAVPTL